MYAYLPADSVDFRAASYMSSREYFLNHGQKTEALKVWLAIPSFDDSQAMIQADAAERCMIY